MLYREIEVEKYWDIPSTDSRKKEKIANAIASDNYIASIKKDGEYIRAIYDTDGEIWIIGRGTNAKEVHNLDKHLVFITEWLKENFTPGTCILGELYVPGKTSRAIRAYTGSLVPKSLKNQKDCPPTFYIFDVWAFSGKDVMNEIYEQRVKYLKLMSSDIKRNQIEFAKTVTGVQEILDYIAEAFENGEEGCVLVQKDSKVTPGKRTSWKTIKVKKEFQDNIDCFLTGNFREPTREYTGSELENWKYWENIHTGQLVIGDSEMFKDYREGAPIEPVTKAYSMGWPGSLEVGVFNKNKTIISLCYISGITDELKEDFAKNKEKYINRPIAISGMMATDASIRHPKFVRFRDDLSLEDCSWSKIFGE